MFVKVNILAPICLCCLIVQAQKKNPSDVSQVQYMSEKQDAKGKSQKKLSATSPQEPLRPVESGIENSGSFALLVCISKWPDSAQFNPVPGALRDCEGMKAGLERMNFVVRVVHNEEATRERILQILSQATLFDHVLAYFSTHGFMFNGQSAFAAYNTTAQSLAASSLMVDEVLAAAKAARPRKLTVLGDVCQTAVLAPASQMSRGRADALEFFSENFAMKDQPESRSVDGAVTYTRLIYAAAPGARAWGDAYGGFFTRSVLKALDLGPRDVWISALTEAAGSLLKKFPAPSGESLGIHVMGSAHNYLLGKLGVVAPAPVSAPRCPSGEIVPDVCLREAWVAFPETRRICIDRVGKEAITIWNEGCTELLGVLQIGQDSQKPKWVGKIKVSSEILADAELTFGAATASLSLVYEVVEVKVQSAPTLTSGDPKPKGKPKTEPKTPSVTTEERRSIKKLQTLMPVRLTPLSEKPVAGLKEAGHE